jgi:hypothetical protein
MPFQPVIVTFAGLQMINDAIGTGAEVLIEKVTAGQGFPATGDDPRTYIALKNYVMDAFSTSANADVLFQTTVRIRIQTNLAPFQFNLNELGVWATLNAGPLTLFAYVSYLDDTGDTITPGGGAAFNRDFAIVVNYTQESPVSTTITLTPIVQLHAATHHGTGIDPITLANSSSDGLLTKTPNDATKVLLGTSPNSFGPVPVHAPTHYATGVDPIPLANASYPGLLALTPADATKVALGTSPNSWGPVPHHAPTHLDNGTDPIPIVTIARTGFVPKLTGNVQQSLRGDGTWQLESPFMTGMLQTWPIAIAVTQPPGWIGFGPTATDVYAPPPPAGWLVCNGADVSTATYPALFALLGYTYGGSGGSFTLPFNYTYETAAPVVTLFTYIIKT